MKKNKGFTLVELLAVIVILAIIMIIAIPAVLQTMNSARQKAFLEYGLKVYTKFQSKWIEDRDFGGVSIPSDAGIIYYTLDDLGYNSTGDYFGSVQVNLLSDKYCRDFDTLNYPDKLCSGTIIYIMLYDMGSKKSFSWVGSLNDKFPDDLSDVVYFKDNKSHDDYMSEHSYQPNYYIAEKTDDMINKKEDLVTMTNQSNQLIESMNLGYKGYLRSDL